MSQVRTAGNGLLRGEAQACRGWKVLSGFRDKKGGQCVGSGVSGGSKIQLRQGLRGWG